MTNEQCQLNKKLMQTRQPINAEKCQIVMSVALFRVFPRIKYTISLPILSALSWFEPFFFIHYSTENKESTGKRRLCLCDLFYRFA